jgi:hypothetical protein
MSPGWRDRLTLIEQARRSRSPERQLMNKVLAGITMSVDGYITGRPAKTRPGSTKRSPRRALSSADGARMRWQGTGVTRVKK